MSPGHEAMHNLLPLACLSFSLDGSSRAEMVYFLKLGTVGKTPRAGYCLEVAQRYNFPLITTGGAPVTCGGGQSVPLGGVLTVVPSSLLD